MLSQLSSKFQYVVSNIPMPKEYMYVTKVNTSMYKSIWRCKTDKVIRDILKQNFGRRGNKMVNTCIKELYHMTQAPSICYLWHYFCCICFYSMVVLPVEVSSHGFEYTICKMIQKIYEAIAINQHLLYPISKNVIHMAYCYGF